MQALEALSSQIRNNDMYDYAEVAETGSTMSTPTSNQDPPFAAESLGDTVINLDEVLPLFIIFHCYLIENEFM